VLRARRCRKAERLWRYRKLNCPIVHEQADERARYRSASLALSHCVFGPHNLPK
jgi:hypothetical protein